MPLRIRCYHKTTDFSYYIICILLSCASIATLFSMAQHAGLELGGALGNLKPAVTQILAAAVGLLGMFVISLLDYRALVQCWPLHALCWGLVLLTFVPGVGYEPPGTGSRSWIALPFGMSFQPTEIAKISFFLTLSGHLERARPSLNRLRTLLPVLCHIGLPVLLVHFQGDDGTALVFGVTGLVMLVAAGLNRWVVAACTVLAAGAAPLFWRHIMPAYQKERIIGLFNPAPYADTIMYQQLQGLAAIAAGGLWGRGLGAPHHYVPLAENDFFFSYFAETFGFVGSLVLLALLFGLMVKVLRTAHLATDNAGSYLCVGVFAVLLFQTVVNVGMNLSLLPVMGVTLPFLSAGGSSVLMLYLSVGLVLCVDRWRKTADREGKQAYGTIQ